MKTSFSAKFHINESKIINFIESSNQCSWFHTYFKIIVNPDAKFWEFKADVCSDAKPVLFNIVEKDINDEILCLFPCYSIVSDIQEYLRVDITITAPPGFSITFYTQNFCVFDTVTCTRISQGADRHLKGPDILYKSITLNHYENS